MWAEEEEIEEMEELPHLKGEAKVEESGPAIRDQLDQKQRAELLTLLDG